MNTPVQPPGDSLVIHDFMSWVAVLAYPSMFARLRRQPPHEHLVGLLDLYVAAVRRGGRFLEAEAGVSSDERRCVLASTLRAQLTAWTSPHLSAEVAAAAMALWRAEVPEPLASDWEQLPSTAGDGFEDRLTWPEGVPYEDAMRQRFRLPEPDDTQLGAMERRADGAWVPVKGRG